MDQRLGARSKEGVYMMFMLTVARTDRDHLEMWTPLHVWPKCKTSSSHLRCESQETVGMVFDEVVHQSRPGILMVEEAGKLKFSARG